MLLSIAIPTRNRYQTLIPVLKCLISISSDELEIVVHDNSDDNSEIKDFLKNINDPRIKYFLSKNKMSQSENFNESVYNCLGEYICLIGDDDFVLPTIIDFISKIKKLKIDIVKFKKPVYYWPNTLSNTGVLQTEKFNKEIVKKSSKKALLNILNKCATDMDDAPSIYHGIVKKSILDKIYNIYGTYFPGPSPDMANCVALLINSNSFSIANIPIVVSGNSSVSMAGLGLIGSHYGNINSKPHLGKINIDEWSKEIPFYWSGPTIWAQSMFAVIKTSNPDLLEKINYDYLYAVLFIYHFKLFNLFFKKTKNFKISLNFFNILLYLFFRRSFNFIKNFFIKNNFHYNLNINSAINLLLSENNSK